MDQPQYLIRLEKFVNSIRNHVLLSDDLKTEVSFLFSGCVQVTIGRFAQVFAKHGLGAIDLTAPFEQQIKLLRKMQNSSTTRQLTLSESESEIECNEDCSQMTVGINNVNVETLRAGTDSVDLASSDVKCSGDSVKVNDTTLAILLDQEQDVLTIRSAEKKKKKPKLVLKPLPAKEKLRKKKIRTFCMQPVARLSKLVTTKTMDETEDLQEIGLANKEAAQNSLGTINDKTSVQRETVVNKKKWPKHLRVAVPRGLKECGPSDGAAADIPVAIDDSGKLKCPKCNRMYSRNDNYKRHYTETHTGGCMVFNCRYCSARYKYRRDLYMHVKTCKKGPNPDPGYKCSNCAKFFESTKTGLYHERSRCKESRKVFTPNESEEEPSQR